MYIADLKTVSISTALIYVFSTVVSDTSGFGRGGSIKNVMIRIVAAIAQSFGTFPLTY